MILSERKYIDPSSVLTSIDDFFSAFLLYQLILIGEKNVQGSQQDIEEFNLFFLERIEEGLAYNFSSGFDMDFALNESNDQEADLLNWDLLDPLANSKSSPSKLSQVK